MSTSLRKAQDGVCVGVFMLRAMELDSIRLDTCPDSDGCAADCGRDHEPMESMHACVVYSFTSSLFAHHHVLHEPVYMLKLPYKAMGEHEMRER